MKEYFILRKKRLLHIFIIILLWIAICGVSTFFLFFDKNASIRFIAIPIIDFICGYHIREYRDWVVKKYPKKKSILSGGKGEKV